MWRTALTSNGACRFVPRLGGSLAWGDRPARYARGVFVVACLLAMISPWSLAEIANAGFEDGLADWKMFWTREPGAGGSRLAGHGEALDNGAVAVEARACRQSWKVVRVMAGSGQRTRAAQVACLLR